MKNRRSERSSFSLLLARNTNRDKESQESGRRKRKAWVAGGDAIIEIATGARAFNLKELGDAAADPRASCIEDATAHVQLHIPGAPDGRYGAQAAER